MTWSSAFQEKLREGIFEPIIVLHVMEWPSTPGTEFYAASAPGYGFPEIIGPGLQITGSSVTPVSWRYTHGSCSVEICTDQIGLVSQSAMRGALCEILIGFTGWDIGDFEPVFAGRVQNIRGVSPNYVLDLWDCSSILNSRLNTGSYASFLDGNNNVFPNVSSSNKTTLTTQYETSHNELDVTSAAALEMPTSSSTYPGVVYVDNGTNDPFFLTYTGKSGNTLTGVTTSDILGTTRAQSTTADTVVYNAAYLAGSPAEIFIRLLVSGSGAGSSYDVYPETWGWGLPQSFIDVGDAAGVYLSMVAAAGAGTYALTYAQKDAVANSWEWLQGWFGTLGLVPVQKHGRLTLRPVQDPNDPLVSSGVVIDDHDIAEIQEWGAYHPDAPAEYLQVKVTATGATALITPLTAPETSPVAGRLSFNNTDKIFVYGSQNVAEIMARVGLWGTNLPEYVTIRCSGMRLATLAPLDVVQLSSELLTDGRINATYTNGYDHQPCLVLKVSPDYYLGEVTLTLAAIDPL